MSKISWYALAERERLTNELHKLAPETRKIPNVKDIHGLKWRADEVRLILKYSTQSSLAKRRFKRQTLRTLWVIALTWSALYIANSYTKSDTGIAPHTIEKNLK